MDFVIVGRVYEDGWLMGGCQVKLEKLAATAENIISVRLKNNVIT